MQRYKAITLDGNTFQTCETKSEIEKYIDSQIETRGMLCRSGYLIQFKDGLQLEFVKSNGNRIKNYKVQYNDTTEKRMF